MDNPYQAPSSRVEDLRKLEPELAGRGVRFGASLLDGLIVGAVLLPIEYASGMFQQAIAMARDQQHLPYGTLILWALIGLAVFALIQGYPLLTDGQTWGKKICSIRIVALDDSKPSVQQLLARYATYLLPGRVPFIGGLFSLVNICFIFREDRRCIHDLVAGTRVVTV